MVIKRGSGVAVWRQIAEELQSSIARGTFAVGAQLPTEMELAGRFNVNRHTVRRAIAALANDGYVEATRGRGTFVAQRPILYPLTERTRFSEIISAQDLQPGGRLIASLIEPAQRIVAEKLGVTEGCDVIRMETLRVAESRPIIVATSWFDVQKTPNLIADYAEIGTVSEALARAGFADYRRQSTWVSAGSAASEDCTYLRVPVGAPILLVESLNVDADEKPLQFTRARFLAEAVQLVIES